MIRQFQSIAILTTLIAVSFTSAAEQSKTPSGTYTATARGQKISMTLDKGKVLVTFNDKLAVKGTYKITKDEIEFTDQEGPQACQGDVKTGTYRWRLKGNMLRFTNVNDKCEGRKVGLTTAEWSKATAAADPDNVKTADKKTATKTDKKQSADVMKLQGKWLAADGFEADMTITFKGNKFTLADGDRIVTGTITVDVSQIPKTMDLTVTGGSAGRELERFEGKTAKAIYELDAGKLKWCASEPGKEGRPTKFDRDGGGDGDLDVLYMVFKREKE